ncbi:hypothetical protein BaRGS_00007702, partial [Batillaria attramentaria]
RVPRVTEQQTPHNSHHTHKRANPSTKKQYDSTTGRFNFKFNPEQTIYDGKHPKPDVSPIFFQRRPILSIRALPTGHRQFTTLTTSPSITETGVLGARNECEVTVLRLDTLLTLVDPARAGDSAFTGWARLSDKSCFACSVTVAVFSVPS